VSVTINMTEQSHFAHAMQHYASLSHMLPSKTSSRGVRISSSVPKHTDYYEIHTLRPGVRMKGLNRLHVLAKAALTIIRSTSTTEPREVIR